MNYKCTEVHAGLILVERSKRRVGKGELKRTRKGHAKGGKRV
jgi:hypothetical protein